MDQTEIFEGERPRLLGIATRVLGDHAEAEDVVQQAWLRLDRTTDRGEVVDNLPAWLTTVTTRLCLDRLRARTPVPVDDEQLADAVDASSDPADDVALADTVGVALQAVQVVHYSDHAQALRAQGQLAQRHFALVRTQHNPGALAQQALRAVEVVQADLRHRLHGEGIWQRRHRGPGLKQPPARPAPSLRWS